MNSRQPLTPEPGEPEELVLRSAKSRQVEHQGLVTPGQDVVRRGDHLVRQRLATRGRA